MADQIPAHPGPTVGRSQAGGLSKDITFESVSGMVAKTYGLNLPVKQTVFTFTAMALSITDALAYSSKLIGTFPKGKIAILQGASSLAFTTTSAIVSTLNSAVVVSYALGSAAASNIVLSTTMINIFAGSGATVPTFTSSTTINVASATVTHHFLGTGNTQVVDGSSTAAPIYFNLAVPTITDIDADSTLTVTGTITLLWSNLGGFDFAGT